MVELQSYFVLIQLTIGLSDRPFSVSHFSGYMLFEFVATIGFAFVHSFYSHQLSHSIVNWSTIFSVTSSTNYSTEIGNIVSYLSKLLHCSTRSLRIANQKKKVHSNLYITVIYQKLSTPTISSLVVTHTKEENINYRPKTMILCNWTSTQRNLSFTFTQSTHTETH